MTPAANNLGTKGPAMPTDEPKKVPDRKWTVMVFMAAETIDGSAPLHEAAEADLDEMRAVGSGDTLNIFVQLHGHGEPRRYHIGVTDEPVTSGSARSNRRTGPGKLRGVCTEDRPAPSGRLFDVGSLGACIRLCVRT